MGAKLPVSRILKIAVTVGLVALLIRLTDWGGVAGYLADIRWPWMVVYLAAVIVGNVVSACRWRLLAVAGGAAARCHTFLGWYLTGTFLNNFFPGFVGGDAYRIFRSARTFSNGLRTPAAMTVIADRIGGLYGAMLLTVALFVVAMMTDGAGDMPAAAALIGMIGVVSIGLVVAMTAVIANRETLAAAITSRLPERLRGMVGHLASYDGGRIATNTFWGAVFAAVGVIGANYVLFLAFGVTLPVVPFAILALCASVVASLPVSIGNIGVKEWAYVVLLDSVGVDPSLAVAVVLVSRVAQAALSLLGAATYYADTVSDAGTTPIAESRRWHDALSTRHIVGAVVGLAVIIGIAAGAVVVMR